MRARLFQAAQTMTTFGAGLCWGIITGMQAAHQLERNPEARVNLFGSRVQVLLAAGSSSYITGWDDPGNTLANMAGSTIAFLMAYELTLAIRQASLEKTVAFSASFSR